MYVCGFLKLIFWDLIKKKYWIKTVGEILNLNYDLNVSLGGKTNLKKMDMVPLKYFMKFQLPICCNIKVNGIDKILKLFENVPTNA